MKNLVLLLLVMVIAIFSLGTFQAREGLPSSDQDAVTATLDDMDIGTNNAETPNTWIVINGDSDDTMTGQTTTAPAIATRSSLLNLIDEFDRSRYGSYRYLARTCGHKGGGVAAVCRSRPASSAGTYSNCMFTTTNDGAALLI